MPDLDSTNSMPEDYEAAVWRWLAGASERWTTLDISDLTATENSALTRLVLSGQFQLRIHIVARGAATEPAVHATCVVLGDYKRSLVQAMRGAVPEFGERVVIQPPSKLEYRLSSAGLATQSEARQFGGGRIQESLLAKTLQFVVPGVVNITEMDYEAPSPAVLADEATPAPAPTSVPDANASKKPKVPAWPVTKTDGYVAQYWTARHARFVELARDVLDDRNGANKELTAEFGPAAIARHITEKVGTDNQRACRSQDVLKTHTYRHVIQPLLQSPPRKPANWDQMVGDRTDEDLPDILDDVPFEDDEL